MTDRIAQWKAEEAVAQIHGWDFSHIEGRCIEEPLPWDYRAVVETYRRPEVRILDMDTGGGEFLLSLGHPHDRTAATENYPPNVALCRQVLLPLGIDFRPADAEGTLPFSAASFDLVLNRHGSFCAEEIHRVLKPGGVFVTQQVGAENDRAFVELLCGSLPPPFPEQYLEPTAEKFRKAGFSILDARETFRTMKFLDVGALVWFARIIQWEFPDFSVDSCLPGLQQAQHILETCGCIEGQIHRFLLAAKKEE